MTNPRQRHWLFGTIFFASTLASAVECTDRPECWPTDSAMYTGLLAKRQSETLEPRLAKAHSALIKKLATTADDTESLQTALGSQQAAWLDYRLAECQLIGALSGAGGSWPAAHARSCELRLSERRLRQILAATRCLDKISAPQQRLESHRCLLPLAPLAKP